MTDIVKISAQIARTAHDGQFRMGKEKRPYIVHPALVAELVEQLATQDAETLAAAWLHDVIEDTEVQTKANFEQSFAELGFNNLQSISRVYDLVDELSMPSSVEWKRIRSFQIDKINEMTPQAKILKMADQVANTFDVILYPPTEWPAAKVRNYFFKAIDICTACAPAAPKLYELFLDLYAQRETLTRGDISKLIAKHRSGKAYSSQQADTPQEHDTAATVRICEDISINTQTKNDSALTASIDISKDADLADRFREYIEDKGIYTRTLPLTDKSKRTLVFSTPVDVAYCQGFIKHHSAAHTLSPARLNG